MDAVNIFLRFDKLALSLLSAQILLVNIVSCAGNSAQGDLGVKDEVMLI